MPHILSEREQIVVAMWEDNRTQREIACELGVSLGVVSGIAMRLKQKGVIKHKTKEQVVVACLRRAVAPMSKKSAVVVAEKPSPPPAPVVAAPPPVPEVADMDRVGIGIMRLTKNTCRWVLPRKGRDGMARYCGEAVDHRGFCRCHAARAFQIPNDWKVSSTPYKRLQALITTK